MYNGGWEQCVNNLFVYWVKGARQCVLGIFLNFRVLSYTDDSVSDVLFSPCLVFVSVWIISRLVST